MNRLQVAKNRQEESTVGIVIAIEVVDWDQRIGCSF